MNSPLYPDVGHYDPDNDTFIGSFYGLVDGMGLDLWWIPRFSKPAIVELVGPEGVVADAYATPGKPCLSVYHSKYPGLQLHRARCEELISLAPRFLQLLQ